jgi:hypothetical protein
MTSLVIGFIFVVVGTSCVAFGLVTGAMPPFPSNVASSTRYRNEEPVLFWINGGLYAVLAICGCYLVASNWTSFLRSLA